MKDDDVIDVIDKETFIEKMREEEKNSKCPCGTCKQYDGCVDSSRCKDYRKWRKRWLKNATSW